MSGVHEFKLGASGYVVTHLAIHTANTTLSLVDVSQSADMVGTTKHGYLQKLFQQIGCASGTTPDHITNLDTVLDTNLATVQAFHTTLNPLVQAASDV